MTAPTPADVPGQGEVEGLAEALSRHHLDTDGNRYYCGCGHDYGQVDAFLLAPESVEAVMDAHVAAALAPFLAGRDAEVARAALRAAADALEGALGVPGSPRNLYEFRTWLRDLATDPRA